MAATSKKIAIVGAGISGVLSGAHLLNAGLDITVFERSSAAGGIWLFDERTPIETEYSRLKPSEGDNFDSSTLILTRSQMTSNSELELLHAPPGPAYMGLHNNISTRLLRTTLSAFPDGTPDIVSHSVLKDYIQGISQKSGVHDRTWYRTRVEKLVKNGDRWELKTSTLTKAVGNERLELTEKSWFDSVVISSGHYHAPSIPDIPGIRELKRNWPQRVWHSKSYRSPDLFMNKNILLVGAGVSSTDIAKEAATFAKAIYQTSRSGHFDLPRSTLPDNAIRVSHIREFRITEGASCTSDDLNNDDPLPITVILSSGNELCNIDYVILCTGYWLSLPFLKHYHNDDLNPKDANDEVLVTDGRQFHNLHKDIFYIPDPTLVLVGVPFYTATFSLFDFQAIAVAAVLSGRVNLPSKDEMRREYQQRVESKGYGRPFHSLRNQEEDYVGELLDWINPYLLAGGYSVVKSYSEDWKQAKEALKEQAQRLFASDVGETLSDIDCNIDLPVCG